MKHLLSNLNDIHRSRSVQGPVYTKLQRQRCDNSAMMLELKTTELLQFGVATHFEGLHSFHENSIIASSQSYRGFDADAWCKRALTGPLKHTLPACNWIHDWLPLVEMLEMHFMGSLNA